MRSFIVFGFFISIFLSGCTYLSIGDRTSSLCDGDCNFKEAGVCADTITIYKHRKDLTNRKVKEHWFAEDEDPYYEDSNDLSNFTQINEEDIYDYEE